MAAGKLAEETSVEGAAPRSPGVHVPQPIGAGRPHEGSLPGRKVEHAGETRWPFW